MSLRPNEPERPYLFSCYCDNSDDDVETVTALASASGGTEQCAVGVSTFLGTLINYSHSICLLLGPQVKENRISSILPRSRWD